MESLIGRLANQPLVIDNGTGMLKAGFAGGNAPRSTFRSCVGRVKHTTRAMPGGAFQGGDYFVGPKLQEHRGAMLLSYPLEHGIVQNWADMEKLWTYVYDKDNLNVNSEDHPVLLTEAPLNPYSNRELAAELFFEKFNVPALYVELQAILSLYASGRTTGIVLDCGEGVTHCVPVYEGLVIKNGINRMDIAGRDITQHLQLLLRRAGRSFTTSAEMEIVRQLKEKCCVVALNPSTEEQSYLNSANSPKSVKYVLPDGSSVDVGPETFRAPEILFNPMLIGSESRGIHDCLVTSIMRCDMDVRKTLFSQVVLSGGSTLFPGFGERLLNETRKHHAAPKDTKIRIAAPPERIHTTWIGGSILAALSTFKTMWVTKQEYSEQGNRLLHNS